MKVIDFGSGDKYRAINLWSNPNSIQALQNNITSQFESLQIYAYDPIRIKSESTFSSKKLTISFCDDIDEINNVEAICVLNPNPLAIMTEIDDYDPESYQSATYIPTLANVIRDKLNLGGRVMLQFDTALEEAEYGNGIQTFIDILIGQLIFTDVSLKEITRKTDHPEFPCGVYEFSSFCVLEKGVREKKSRGKIKKRR